LTDIFDTLKAALADCYVLERELGCGGMADVYPDIGAVDHQERRGHHLRQIWPDCHLSVHQRQPRQLLDLEAAIGRVAEDVLNAWGEKAQ
jgi:hypothetical protein